MKVYTGLYKKNDLSEIVIINFNEYLLELTTILTLFKFLKQLTIVK
jgi:hypothetical protein